MKNELISKYSVNFTYKYIQSDSNPTDLISRGLRFSKFVKNLEYWQHGPKQLNTVHVEFPQYDLRCLNKEQQSVVQTLVLDNNTEVKPLIDFDRFSDFSKLFKSVGVVFKFINRCKKVNNDENYQAKVYLLQKVFS